MLRKEPLKAPSTRKKRCSKDDDDDDDEWAPLSAKESSSKTESKLNSEESDVENEEDIKEAKKEENISCAKDEFFSTSQNLHNNTSTSSNRVRLTPKRHCNATEFLADDAVLKEIDSVVDTFRHELNITNPYRSYRIVEDFIMLQGMSQHQSWRRDRKPGWGPRFWKEWIATKPIDRPLESLRDHYKRFVRNLSKHDIELIINWVRRNRTANAFIHYIGSGRNIRGDKYFSHVSRDDPMRTKRENFGGRKDVLTSSSSEDDDDDNDDEDNKARKDARKQAKKEEQEKSNRTLKSEEKSVENSATKIAESDSEGEAEREDDVNEIILKIADEDSEIVSGGEVERLYWKNEGMDPNEEVKEEE